MFVFRTDENLGRITEYKEFNRVIILFFDI